ncbi:MAG: hypothetical protein JSY10_28475 [Paenibacillus sp.]|nr:hypothetical protein [Paenibacillus sp.]
MADAVKIQIFDNITGHPIKEKETFFLKRGILSIINLSTIDIHNNTFTCAKKKKKKKKNVAESGKPIFLMP